MNLMHYRWMLCGGAALVLIFPVSMAKEGAPWPIYLGLVLALVACVVMAMVFHSRDRLHRPR